MDFIVFHHCRHLWSNRSPIDYKGNEKLLKGFKKFTQNKERNKILLNSLPNMERMLINQKN